MEGFWWRAKHGYASNMWGASKRLSPRTGKKPQSPESRFDTLHPKLGPKEFSWLEGNRPKEFGWLEGEPRLGYSQPSPSPFGFLVFSGSFHVKPTES